jgi:hypothetical protein
MFKQRQYLRVSIFTAGLILIMHNALSLNVLNNSSKAVFIFDMAKYIDYGPGFADSAVFKIGILDNASELFWAMGELVRTRKTIQDKPVQLVLFRTEEKILHTQILFVNKSSGYNLNKA